jgi:hypothetical protein
MFTLTPSRSLPTSSHLYLILRSHAHWHTNTLLLICTINLAALSSTTLLIWVLCEATAQWEKKVDETEHSLRWRASCSVCCTYEAQPQVAEWSSK